MSEVDYSEYNLYDLCAVLTPGNAERSTAIDPYLANAIQSKDDMGIAFSFIAYTGMEELLPKTKDKINSILREYLESADPINWWEFRNYFNWLSPELSNALAETWLNSDSTDGHWIIHLVPKESKLAIKALEKITALYKKKRSSANVKLIEDLFIKLPSDKVEDACNIIAKATPAVSACLLSRSDINEKYTLKGLKALSKLSTQRDVNIKIDFQMLKHLGPKSRLDAMKQLLGMLGNYYSYQNKTKEHPFKKLPQKSEVETFLFPCSLKYNDQVVELIKRYDELTRQKEVSNGKCI